LLLYVSNRVEDARISRMEDEIATLRSAVTLLFNDTGVVMDDWLDLVRPTGTNWRGPYIQKSPAVDLTNTIWINGSPWKTNYRLHSIANAPGDRYFARDDQLYPFRNAVVLEVVQVTNQTPSASLQKVDQDLDNNNGEYGFIVEANSNQSPFVTTGTGTMPGLSATYSGTTGKSVYILLATF